MCLAGALMAADDLAAWLTQVWDEQEAIVLAAIKDDGGQDGGLEDSFDVLTRGRDQAGPLAFEPRFGEPLARMMVRNTPRLALARIAADRQILAACQRVYRAKDPEYGDGSHDLADEILSLLAQPYAERGGFRDEWRVT